MVDIGKSSVAKHPNGVAMRGLSTAVSVAAFFTGHWVIGTAAGLAAGYFWLRDGVEETFKSG